MTGKRKALAAIPGLQKRDGRECLLQHHALRWCSRSAAQRLTNASDIGAAAAQLVSDLLIALAILAQLADDLAILVVLAADPGAASDAAFGPGTFQASNHALREPVTFLLGNGGENRDDGILEHAGGVEVLLAVALEGDAVGVKLAQILVSFVDALADEAIERPEQDAIELAAGSCGEHGLELDPVAVFTARLVDIFVYNLPLLALAVISELAELVERILSLVFGADSGINGAFHGVFSYIENKGAARLCQGKSAQKTPLY